MPTVVKTLDIAKNQQSTIWDYRQETSPNGGTIPLRACVWHIPVISNVDGRGDLDTLRRVLLDQGLMVQFGNGLGGERRDVHARGQALLARSRRERVDVRRRADALHDRGAVDREADPRRRLDRAVPGAGVRDPVADGGRRTRRELGWRSLCVRGTLPIR
jgi:hypothetical protein